MVINFLYASYSQTRHELLIIVNIFSFKEKIYRMIYYKNVFGKKILRKQDKCYKINLFFQTKFVINIQRKILWNNNEQLNSIILFDLFYVQFSCKFEIVKTVCCKSKGFFPASKWMQHNCYHSTILYEYQGFASIS